MATTLVPGAWLTMLARADVLGRSSRDVGELSERVELFDELCRDLGCREGPRSYPSDLTRYLFLAGERQSPDGPAFDGTKFEVVLLAGLPGAGKDAWCRRHGGGRPVVSLDAVRRSCGLSPSSAQGVVVDAGRRLARQHLRRREPFVWNATNVSRTLRSGLVSLFRGYGARVRVVWVETSYDDMLRRNRERPPETCVPSGVLERLVDKFDPPTVVEAPVVEWSTN